MFLETICIKDGVAQHVEWHAARVKRTAARFDFNSASILGCLMDLKKSNSGIPEKLRGVDGKVKCRIVYNDAVREITFEKYIPKEIRSLKLVEGSPDYAFKFADRSELNALLSRREGHDEILIARDGYITDTSYSNVVLQREGDFYTPSRPLLNGTKRQRLVKEGIIKEIEIPVSALSRFERILLINAMLDLEDNVWVPTIEK